VIADYVHQSPILESIVEITRAEVDSGLTSCNCFAFANVTSPSEGVEQDITFDPGTSTKGFAISAPAVLRIACWFLPFHF
jgi:hypothetical protein